MLTKSHIEARWSSLVARRAHNPKAGGSNPPLAINFWLAVQRINKTHASGINLYSILAGQKQLHGGMLTMVPPFYLRA